MKGVKFGNYHSYDTWGLLLTAKNIGSPIVKEKKIDIEGADGDLDYTEVFGSVKYGNRILKFEFQKAMKPSELVSLASDIQDAIHGLKMAVTLDDDPDWYYSGRVSVKDFNWKKGIGTIEIEVDAEPYKLKHKLSRQIAVLEGKNLFDCKTADVLLRAGATVTRIDTGIRVTAETAVNYTNAAIKVFPSKAVIGKTITFSWVAHRTNTERFIVVIGYAAANAQTYHKVIETKTANTLTMTVEESYANQYPYITLWLYVNDNVPATVGAFVNFVDIQVELGDTPTTFTAYDSTEKTVTVNAENLRQTVVPTIHASQSVVVEKNGVSVAVDGSQTVESLLLEQGNNTFTVTGKGVVAIEYREGRL